MEGDCRGAWITEADPVRPANAKTEARVVAENRWLALSRSTTSSPPVSVFRLAGVYGPGRSALEVASSFNS
jgi:nucleoside-diphosphate-sugar epimerase